MAQRSWSTCAIYTLDSEKYSTAMCSVHRGCVPNIGASKLIKCLVDGSLVLRDGGAAVKIAARAVLQMYRDFFSKLK
jgi:hypothetical protein